MTNEQAERRVSSLEGRLADLTAAIVANISAIDVHSTAIDSVQKLVLLINKNMQGSQAQSATISGILSKALELITGQSKTDEMLAGLIKDQQATINKMGKRLEELS